MADTGALSVGTGEAQPYAGSGGFNWGNPSNITASDNSDSTFTASSVSNYLVGRNVSAAVPSGAIIDGVLVEVEAANTFGNKQIIRVTLWNSGELGTAKTVSQSLTSTDTYYSWGGSSDTWGASLTPAIVNGSGFGAGIVSNAGSFGTMAVDHMRITVYYTESTQDITLNHISSGTTVFNMGVTPDQNMTHNHLGPTSQLFNPSVSPGAVDVVHNLLGPTSQLFQPTIIPEHRVVHQTKLSSTTLYQMSTLFTPQDVNLIPIKTLTLGPNDPSDTTVLAAGDLQWDGLSFAFSSDDQYMRTDGGLFSPLVSDTLLIHDYGLSLPEDPTGVMVKIEASDLTGSGGEFEIHVQLYWSSSLQGSEKTVQFSGSTDVTEILGGVDDLWGGSPTEADIESADFGIAIYVEASSGTTLPGIDHIQVTAFGSENTTVYEPTIFAEQFITLNHLGPTSALYQMSVNQNQQMVHNFLSPTTALHEMAVTPGAVTITHDLLGPTSQLFEMSTSLNVVLAHLGPTSTLHQMGVSPGPVTITHDLIGPTSVLYQQAIYPDQLITHSHLGPLSVVYDMGLLYATELPSAIMIDGTTHYVMRDGSTYYLLVDVASRYGMLDVSTRYTLIDLISHYKMRRST